MAITPDNLHLSEPTPLAAITATAATPIGMACTDPMVLHFIEAATASNTRRAYDSDLKHFLTWGGSLPASPDVVARYLAAHATTHAVATLARHLVAIRRAHAVRDLPDPVRSELVRLTFRGIRRAHGRPQRRAAALTAEEMEAIVASLGDSLRDARDRALLLLGFAGAFRRSELSRIDCKSIERTARGVIITIPKSKTDQARFGSGEKRFDTTRQAIIFIMRELRPTYRGTAWIATDSGDIQIDEIEQLYRQVNPRTRSSGKR